MEKLEKLRLLMDEADMFGNKFFGKGVASAGTKLRGTMQEIKSLAQEIRIEVQDIKNNK